MLAGIGGELPLSMASLAGHRLSRQAQIADVVPCFVCCNDKEGPGTPGCTSAAGGCRRSDPPPAALITTIYTLNLAQTQT